MLSKPQLSASSAAWTARESVLAVAMLAFALVLGGGGTPAPRAELAVECVAALIAMLWLLSGSPATTYQRVPRSAWLLTAVVAAIPIIQLIPLPPVLWQSLPGRAIEREALSLIDLDATWRSWSLAPNRTFSALLSLGPPLLLLLLTATLNHQARLRLVATLAVIGLLSIVIGALQLTADDASPLRFYGVTTPQLTGFQANHNSTADLLLIALIASTVVLRATVEQRRLPNNRALVLGIAGGVNSLFVIGTVLTASRMGIILLPLALFASFWILRPWLPISRQVLAGSALILAGLALVGLLLARDNAVISAVVARFDFSGELRPQLWQDGLFVVRQHFPFGVGMGNFMPALIADERLEAVRPFLPNRAHNDFIELAAEAGLLGIAALAGSSWLLGRAAWSALRSSSPGRPGQAAFAAAALLILALHSLVDYPLRSMSLACLAAICAGLFIVPRSGAPDPIVAGDKA